MIGDFFNAYENCSLAACGSLPRGITVWNSSYRDMRMMPFWDSNAEVAHVIFGFRYFNAGLVLTFIEPLGAFYRDRKSTRLNSSHVAISYAVFCLKKKKVRSGYD